MGALYWIEISPPLTIPTATKAALVQQLAAPIRFRAGSVITHASIGLYVFTDKVRFCQA